MLSFSGDPLLVDAGHLRTTAAADVDLFCWRRRRSIFKESQPFVQQAAADTYRSRLREILRAEKALRDRSFGLLCIQRSHLSEG